MRWFNSRVPPRDIWEEPVPAPLGDIEAAERIRHICRSATASAEWVGGVAPRADSGKRSNGSPVGSSVSFAMIPNLFNMENSFKAASPRLMLDVTPTHLL